MLSSSLSDPFICLFQGTSLQLGCGRSVLKPRFGSQYNGRFVTGHLHFALWSFQQFVSIAIMVDLP